MNMRTVIALIGLLFCISIVNAQSDTVFFSTELSLKVSALDYIKAKSDLKRLINAKALNLKVIMRLKITTIFSIKYRSSPAPRSAKNI